MNDSMLKRDRMMGYIHFDKLRPGYLKWGEHWVHNMTLEEARRDTAINRIRHSYGVMKYLYDNEEVEIVAIFDMSAFAKANGRFYPHAGCDKLLHQYLPGRMGNRSEVFKCDTQSMIRILEPHVGPIDPTVIQNTLKSQSYIKQLLKVKDKEECILTEGDSVDLWKKLIDKIPDRIFKNSRCKFLVFACGYGTEIRVLIEKLSSYGWSDDKIRKAIVINDKSGLFTKDWKDLGYTVVVGDLLYLDFGMQFDVVVGNPPYQNNKAQGQGALWSRIIAKAHTHLKDGGICAAITPGRFVYPNSVYENTISGNKVIYLNVGECSRHFEGVGRSADYFGAFVYEKTNKKQGNNQTEIHTLTDNFYADVSEMAFVPRRGDRLTYAAFKQLQMYATNPAKGRMAFQRGDRNIALQSRKVGFSYTQRNSIYEKLYIKDMIGNADFHTHHINYTWLAIPDQATDETLDSVFLSKTFRYFAKHMIDGDFSTSCQTWFPNLDLTRVWTDEEIYKEIGFDEAVIAAIEKDIV